MTINEGDTITVSDNGRGIPVDTQPQTGRPALEVVFTVLHAGGKFGGGGYKVSGGLHGVGASVVNALSEWLSITSFLSSIIVKLTSYQVAGKGIAPAGPARWREPAERGLSRMLAGRVFHVREGSIL